MLVEKVVFYEIENIMLDVILEDLMEVNLYGSVLILVDCDLVLFNFCIIMEYFDECFFYLLFLFVYFVLCVKCCLIMFCIE